MKYDFTPRGVCSRGIHIDLDGETIRSVRFDGGCSGNTQGVAALQGHQVRLQEHFLPGAARDRAGAGVGGTAVNQSGRDRPVPVLFILTKFGNTGKLEAGRRFCENPFYRQQLYIL